MSHLAATRGKLALLAVLTISLVVGVVSPKVLATCPAQSLARGEVTANFSIPTNGTYRVWSRVKASSSTNNSYILELDGTTCGVVVGDASLPASAWAWVNYKSGSTTTPIDINLSAGSHSLAMIGREDNVAIDRIIFTTDTACVPSGTGDNCASVSVTPPPPGGGGGTGDGSGGDTSGPPTVGSGPGSTATIIASSDPITVAAGTDLIIDQPSDLLNKTIDKVEYYIDGKLVATEAQAPYSYKVDTAKLKNGKHTLKSVIYYADGTTKSTTQQLNVKNTAHKITSLGVGISLIVLAAILGGLFLVQRRRGGFVWHGKTIIPAKVAVTSPVHDPDLLGGGPQQSANIPKPNPDNNVVEFRPTVSEEPKDPGTPQ